MKKKLLFIFNPKSGKGLIKEHLVNIVDIMTKAGYKITIYPTQCQGDAIKKVRKNAKKYTRRKSGQMRQDLQRNWVLPMIL